MIYTVERILRDAEFHKMQDKETVAAVDLYNNVTNYLYTVKKIVYHNTKKYLTVKEFEDLRVAIVGLDYILSTERQSVQIIKSKFDLLRNTLNIIMERVIKDNPIKTPED